jgi:pimeloyl-ACP methyl ester carboxylesterase
MTHTISSWLARRLSLFLIAAISISLSCSTQAKPDGRRDTLQMTANGIEITVFTYRPRGCGQVSILFVFHGVDRNADDYRDKSMDVAQATCMMIFAPLFDKDRFPTWRYQRGGVMKDGAARDHSDWTGLLVHQLIDAARREVNSPDAKVYMFGHSAGAQFLSRFAAYTPRPGIERIVVANPSAHVAPSIEETAPYGFGGLVSEFESYAMLKAYLAAPVTIYLGQEDTGDKNLVDEDAAERQGATRLERGRTIFRQAQEAAKKRGWAFDWILVEVPGVGHSSSKMLRADEFYQAMGLESGEQPQEKVPAYR